MYHSCFAAFFFIIRISHYTVNHPAPFPLPFTDCILIKIDEKKEEVSFDDSYLMNPEQGDTITMAAQTKLMAAIQAEMVDVMVMREEVSQ